MPRLECSRRLLYHSTQAAVAKLDVGDHPVGERLEDLGADALGLVEPVDASIRAYGGQYSRMAWWVTGTASFDVMRMLEQPDPDQVTGLLNSVRTGAGLPSIDGEKPAWLSSIAWVEPETGLMWRADETERVTEAPIKPGGILTVDPQLPATWWSTLDTSLDALAAAETTRVATLHTTPITPARVAEEIAAVLRPGINTMIEQWVPAHADFAWSNLTGPECWILDWEDWGLAPRGLDAAMLWAASLAIPGLAEQVRQHRHEDLESRDGQLMQLFVAAGILGAPAGYARPLLDPGPRGNRAATQHVPVARSSPPSSSAASVRRSGDGPGARRCRGSRRASQCAPGVRPGRWWREGLAARTGAGTPVSGCVGLGGPTRRRIGYSKRVTVQCGVMPFGRTADRAPRGRLMTSRLRSARYRGGVTGGRDFAPSLIPGTRGCTEGAGRLNLRPAEMPLRERQASQPGGITIRAETAGLKREYSFLS